MSKTSQRYPIYCLQLHHWRKEKMKKLQLNNLNFGSLRKAPDEESGTPPAAETGRNNRDSRGRERERIRQKKSRKMKRRESRNLVCMALLCGVLSVVIGATLATMCCGRLYTPLANPTATDQTCLDGQGGNDILEGRSGAVFNILIGGTGDDTLIVTSPHSLLIGGNGGDLFDVFDGEIGQAKSLGFCAGVDRIKLPANDDWTQLYRLSESQSVPFDSE